MRVLTAFSLLLCTACASKSPSPPGSTPDLATPPKPVFTPSVSMPSENPRWGMPLVHLPDERRFVGFGGSLSPKGDVAADSWAFSMGDHSWTHLVDSSAPPPRYCHCLAYLPAKNEVLLVG